MFKLKKTSKGFLVALVAVILFNLGSTFMNPIFESNSFVPSAHAAPGDEEKKPENKPEPSYQDKLKAIGVGSPQENTDNAQTTKDIVQETAQKVTKVHRIFAPLINYFAFQIGNFLGSDYVYQGSMGQMLQKIWVISRNLVNIAFVFYLLWIAIQTIFKQEGGLDDLKKNLIVFTFALIAVNFSWLATKVILDAANVVTHVVFAIPSGISDPPKYEPCQVNTNDKQPLKGLCYPTKIIAPADSGSKPVLYWQDKEGDDDDCSKVEKSYIGEEDEGINISAYNGDGTINGVASPENEALQGRTSMCMESLNLFKYDQNTATIYLTYGMARIQNLVNASASGGDGVQLAVGALMSMVLQIIYGIALGALFIALVIRMMMLWLLVAFSPFIILLIGMGGEGGGEEVKKYLSVEQFISWAFVPAKVGAIFAVAFIMISAGQSMGNLTVAVLDKLSSQSGFTFKILGQESLFAGMGSLQDLLWLIMTIAILWMGVFAVLGKLEIIGPWFSRIQEGGADLAKTVSMLPYNMPWMPLGNGQSSSPRAAFGKLKETFSFADKYDKASEEPPPRLYDAMQKLNYKDFQDQVNRDKFKHPEATKFTKENFNMSLKEFMDQGEAKVKATLSSMPGIKGDTTRTNQFYDAFVKANGGPATAEVIPPAPATKTTADGAPPPPPPDKPSKLEGDGEKKPDPARKDSKKVLEDLAKATADLETATANLKAAEEARDKVFNEVALYTGSDVDKKKENEIKKTEAQTAFDSAKNQQEEAEKRKVEVEGKAVGLKPEDKAEPPIPPAAPTTASTP